MLIDKDQDEFKELILPKITIDDPFIATIQSIIDQEQELSKLDEDEIKSILDKVDGRKFPDWRN